MKPITIGLFGTCDNIRWRDPFMGRFEAEGIDYFNPMVDDWHPGMVDEENRHLLEDDIILFPVLKESLGNGSLAEIGFSVLNAIRASKGRTLIVLIDDTCEPLKDYDETAIKDSVKSRALVKSKVKSLQSHNIILVDTLEEMMAACVDSYTLHRRARQLTDRFHKAG